MKIHVLFFAWVREHTGMDRDVLVLPDQTTVAGAADIICARIKLDPGRAQAIRYAVNEAFVSSNHILHDGDRLALIPPTSGG